MVINPPPSTATNLGMFVAILTAIFFIIYHDTREFKTSLKAIFLIVFLFLFFISMAVVFSLIFNYFGVE